MAVLFICDRCGKKMTNLMSSICFETNAYFPYFYKDKKVYLCRKCMQDLRDFLAGDSEYTEQPDYAFD